MKEVALSVLKIEEARRHVDKNAKGALLYVPPDNDGELIKPHRVWLSDFYDDIYNYLDVSERNRFVTVINKDLGNCLSLDVSIN